MKKYPKNLENNSRYRETHLVHAMLFMVFDMSNYLRKPVPEKFHKFREMMDGYGLVMDNELQTKIGMTRGEATAIVLEYISLLYSKRNELNEIEIS